jgi:hypothetical protein
MTKVIGANRMAGEAGRVVRFVIIYGARSTATRLNYTGALWVKYFSKKNKNFSCET